MRVLIPLPSKDFDPTEVATAWSILRSGCEIVFATPDGIRATADQRMITGEGLGILSPLIRANKKNLRSFSNLQDMEYFHHPISYQDAAKLDFDGILLCGGHAPGIKEYLESEKLQEIISNHMSKSKPIAAICYALILLSRARDNQGLSVIHEKKVTCLPRFNEILSHEITKKRLGNYFKVYPQTTIEDEVVAALADRKQLRTGPPIALKDSLKRLWAGFVVKDGNLVTARWAGDAHRLAMTFKELLV